MKEYRIKKNFAKAGNIGPYPARNVIEAGLLSLLWIWLIVKIPVDLSIKLMLIVLAVFPTLAFGLFGIHGNSLTEIIYRYLKFRLFSKREFGDADKAEFGDREKKLLQIKRKQLERKKAQMCQNEEVRMDGVDKPR